jgi:superfamily II DNA or RNA helicase
MIHRLVPAIPRWMLCERPPAFIHMVESLDAVDQVFLVLPVVAAFSAPWRPCTIEGRFCMNQCDDSGILSPCHSVANIMYSPRRVTTIRQDKGVGQIKFKDVLPTHICSFENDWATKFYAAVLPLCHVGYYRASAYFSANIFNLPNIKNAFVELVKAGGNIRLLTSAELYLKDVESARKGYEERDNETSDTVKRREFLQCIKRDSVIGGHEFLFLLVKYGILDWKVVVKNKQTNNHLLYHEKIGLFLHNNDEYFRFNGSLNETLSAVNRNFESVDIVYNKNDELTSEKIRKRFEDMWFNLNIYLTVEPIMTAKVKFKQKLERNPQGTIVGEKPATEEDEGERDMKELTLRDYQTKAVNAFLADSQDGKKGILSMATGTGKTRTANRILKYLLDAEQIYCAIVSVENTQVLRQWREGWYELRDVYGANQIKNIYSHFSGQDQSGAFRKNPRGSLLVIGRTDPKILKRLIKKMEDKDKQNCLLIHDEVHGLGSPERMTNLKGHTEGFKFALGLSATWKRFDEDQTEFISGEFGGQPQAFFEYGVEEAIRDGHLVEFDYEFVEYERNAKDGAAFEQRMANPGMPWMFEGVYKSSLAKVDALRQWAHSFPDKFTALLKSCVFFCKDSKQGMAVAEFLHEMEFYQFEIFSGVTHEGQGNIDNDAIIQSFKNGTTKVLITYGMIDQGFDMPELQSIVLFESDASDEHEKRRKLIQRLGRMLRKDPGNEEKRGFALDFARRIVDDDYPESKSNHENDDRVHPLRVGLSVFDKERTNWLTSLAKTKEEKK